jgi:hypothetical protein
MERKCRTCKFWHNQNAVIDERYAIVGKHEDKEIGFCSKINNGLLIIPDTNHDIVPNKKGIVTIKIPFQQPIAGLYTKEDFKCKFHKSI